VNIFPLHTLPSSHPYLDLALDPNCLEILLSGTVQQIDYLSVLNWIADQ
jgi:hypothetical protein